MKDILLVFFGGGVGSVLRWMTGLGMMRIMGTQFPYGTLTVNLVGCFVMGLLFRILPMPEEGVSSARLVLMTGVLGGYTTFSAFALDSAALWMKNEPAAAATYLAVTLFGTLLGVALGLIVGKWVIG